jgi:hypothetical protein
VQEIRVGVAVLIMLVICGTGIAVGAQGDSAGEPPSAAALALSAQPAETVGVELEAKRTADSETFRLPNGSFETRIYEGPINYRDLGGSWKPIDEGLMRGQGASFVNGANSFDLDLPARMGAGPV